MFRGNSILRDGTISHLPVMYSRSNRNRACIGYETYRVLLGQILEVVEEHGVVVQPFDVLPVGGVWLRVARGAVDIGRTRAVGKPGEKGVGQ